jgi:hypothetical protein
MANHLSFGELSQLVERRASTVEEARARRHLGHCGRCRSEVEWLTRIWTMREDPAGHDAHSDEARAAHP